MRLKLKEDPKEWRKFALTAAIFASALCFAFWRRGHLEAERFRSALGAVALLLVIGSVWPRTIRPAYRAMMTGSFYIGQITGRVMLAFFFLFALTPLGVVLRVLGKDLLKLKRNPKVQTYWRTARPNGDLNRQF